MCCLFGIIDYAHSLSARQRQKTLSALSTTCEVRGTDATGIAYVNDGHLCVYKRPLPAHKMRFVLPADAAVVMGHTRMTTQGSETRNYNNHPFKGCCGDEAFALAHNGVLHNDRSLRRSLKLPTPKIETDSYIAVQLLEQQNALSLDSLTYMAEQVEGSFSFSVLDQKSRLYLVKGGQSPMSVSLSPHGHLPLCVHGGNPQKGSQTDAPVPGAACFGENRTGGHSAN